MCQEANVLLEPRVGIAQALLTSIATHKSTPLLTSIATALLTSSCLDGSYFADVHKSTPCVSAGSMRHVHE